MDFEWWRSQIRDGAAGALYGRMMLPVAATFLVLGGFVLMMAWQAGPQRLLDEREFAPYTARQDGRIVESWLALDLQLDDMGDSKYWPAFARATPCVVVQAEGQWGEPRAFCGSPHWLHDRGFTIHDLRQITPGVPFDFRRDASGFSMPEIRLEKRALEYLAANKSQSIFYPGTALDELRKRFDRPVELAIVSWSQPAPAFPLAIDPARPAEPLPAAYVQMRRSRQPDWFFQCIVPAFFGIAFWLHGMGMILGALVPVGRVVIGLLPLLALPWWGEELPKAIAHINADAGTEMRRIVGDIDPEGQLEASAPAEAQLRDGVRISFAVQEGYYLDTLGRFTFTPSRPTPMSPDAALAMIAADIPEALTRVGTPLRVEIFDNLVRDKKNGLDQAGLAFLLAGKAALTDPMSSAELRTAARRFLDAFTTTPLPEPRRGQLAFEQKVKLYRSLTDVPVDYIANSAASIVERAEQSEAPKPRRSRR